MRNIASIDNFNASVLACCHLVCPNCGAVGYGTQSNASTCVCQICDSNQKDARAFYSENIRILVDLTHQAYHSKAKVGPVDALQTRDIATILFFCSLKEALLDHFIYEKLNVDELPQRVIHRLFDDNKLANQKFKNLFPSAVGESWESAVSRASAHFGFDFTTVSIIMKDSSLVRNSFMHKGDVLSATPEVAEKCVNSLVAITSLFVALYNVYVAFARGSKISPRGVD